MKEVPPAICSRFHRAVELIGSRWTGAVIQALLRGPTRYAVIRAAIPDISDRMLSDRLRILEAEGLVERRVVPDTPVRVEYQLTGKGRSLDGALAAIGSWAERWLDPEAKDTRAGAALGTPSQPGPPSPQAVQHHGTGRPRIKPRVVG